MTAKPCERTVFVNGRPVECLVASKTIRTWFRLVGGQTVPVATRDYEASLTAHGAIFLTEYLG